MWESWSSRICLKFGHLDSKPQNLYLMKQGHIGWLPSSWILVPQNPPNAWQLVIFPVKSSHKHCMIYDISTQCTVLLTDSEWACLFLFSFFSLSQGKWNCQGVAAEFQHPRAKIILLWSPRTCWPFCWCDCQMGRRQKGIGLLRCTKCGNHRENGEGKRECEQSATNLLHNRKANTNCWGKVSGEWNKRDVYGLVVW